MASARGRGPGRGPGIPINLNPDPVAHSTAANDLPDELLLEIFEWLCPNPAIDYREHGGSNWTTKTAALKNLQMCSKRFYNLATPIRMRNVRISMLDFTKARKFSKMLYDSQLHIAPLIKDIRFDFKDRHRRRFARVDRANMETWRQTYMHRLEKLDVSAALSREIASKVSIRARVMAARVGQTDLEDHRMAMCYIDIEILFILVRLTALQTIEFRLDRVFLDKNAKCICNWQVLRLFFWENEEEMNYLPNLRRILYTSGGIPRADNRQAPPTNPDTVVTTFSGSQLDLSAVEFPRLLGGFMVQDNFAHIDIGHVPVEHTLLRNLVTMMPGTQEIRILFIHPISPGELLYLPWMEVTRLSDSLNAAAASQLRSLSIHDWSSPQNGWAGRNLSLTGMRALQYLDVPAALLFGTGPSIVYLSRGHLLQVLPPNLKQLRLWYSVTDGIPLNSVEPHILALMRATAEFALLCTIGLQWTTNDSEGALDFVNQAAHFGWVHRFTRHSTVTRHSLGNGHHDLDFLFSRRLT